MSIKKRMALSDRRRLPPWLVQLAVLVILYLLAAYPGPAQAQWPPFNFNMDPSYADGKITYQIRFSSQVDWQISDVMFKIPLPQGTRFVEANAPANTQVAFDGREVTFFTPPAQRSIRGAYFVVEVLDPATTIYTTHAWINWKGLQAGSFVSAEFPIDITLPPLNWEEPLEPGVRLETRAAVVDNIVTYEIYPVNLSRQRIWDLWIHAPLPAGATFLSAEAPGIFTYGFNGQEVTFFTLELPADTDVGPLRIKVSVPQVAPGQLTPAAVQGQPALGPAGAGPIIPLLTAQVWANWRNAGRDVGRRVEAEAKSSSGDMIIKPEAGEHVVFDQTGDVPFASYDLTALGLQKIGPTLELIFHTAAPLSPVGEPLEFTLYIDRDCLARTGTLREGFGMDHRIRYRHNRGRITVESWLPDTPGPEAGQTTVEPGQAEAALVEPPPASWRDIEGVNISPIIAENKLILQLPYALVDDDGQFCWLADTANQTKAFASRPPDDDLPNEDALVLARIQLLPPPAAPMPVQ